MYFTDTRYLPCILEIQYHDLLFLAYFWLEAIILLQNVSLNPLRQKSAWNLSQSSPVAVFRNAFPFES